MRKISRTSACFESFSGLHERQICLEKNFWSQLKTLMRHFQLRLMQISFRRRNGLLLRIFVPYNYANSQVGLIYRFF